MNTFLEKHTYSTDMKLYGLLHHSSTLPTTIPCHSHMTEVHKQAEGMYES